MVKQETPSYREYGDSHASVAAKALNRFPMSRINRPILLNVGWNESVALAKYLLLNHGFGNHGNIPEQHPTGMGGKMTNFYDIRLLTHRWYNQVSPSDRKYLLDQKKQYDRNKRLFKQRFQPRTFW